MTPSNGLIKFPAYSAEASMAYGSLDEFEASYTQNFQDGFQPLQTYPAKFHNTVVKFLFQQAQQTYLLCNSMFAELKSIIEDSGQTLDATDLNQLKKAVSILSELQVATATTLGGVKSSAADWKVAVDSDGIMSVNTKDATASAAGLIKLKASGWGVSNSDGTVRTINTARGVAGLVTLPTGTTTTKYLREDGTWVAPPDSKPTWYVYLKVDSGKVYAAVNTTGTAPTGYTLGTTGVALPTTSTHATSATYLRPADSTSTLVTADTSGNLKAHTLELT